MGSRTPTSCTYICKEWTRLSTAYSTMKSTSSSYLQLEITITESEHLKPSVVCIRETCDASLECCQKQELPVLYKQCRDQASCSWSLNVRAADLLTKTLLHCQLNPSRKTLHLLLSSGGSCSLSSLRAVSLLYLADTCISRMFLFCKITAFIKALLQLTLRAYVDIM